MERVAEPVPGPLTERIGKVAARARRWICSGSIFERGRGGRIYNTALVFDPKGALVNSYRKLFPWQPHETATPGDRPAPVFDIPRVGRLGVMICYDGWFPEVARGLALQGAELILHPTLTTTPDREQELVMARANAITNQCYVLNVNAVPSFGGGRSIGVDPRVAVLFELGQAESSFSRRSIWTASSTSARTGRVASAACSNTSRRPQRRRSSPTGGCSADAPAEAPDQLLERPRQHPCRGRPGSSDCCWTARPPRPRMPPHAG
jgi:predicted amidohydrolase